VPSAVPKFVAALLNVETCAAPKPSSVGVLIVGEVRVLFVSVCVSLIPTIADAGA